MKSRKSNQVGITLASAPQRGFMLLEALLALLIFSLGVLSLVGLQANSIASASDAKYRTDASFLADELVGQMWADRANLANYNGNPPAAWLAQVQATLPGASVDIAINMTDVQAGGLPTATIQVGWQAPGQSAHSYTTSAQISGAP